MKTRKSNSYVKIGLYLLGGALVGGVLGVGAYMFLDNWGQGLEGMASQLYSGLQASILPVLAVLLVLSVLAGEINCRKLKKIETQLPDDADISADIQFAFSEKTLGSAIKFLNKNESYGFKQILFIPKKSGAQVWHKETVDKLQELISLAQGSDWGENVFFSSCLATALTRSNEIQIPENLCQNCKAGLLSAYISSDMYFLTCPGDQRKRWAVDLRKSTIQKAWTGPIFDFFRQGYIFSCKGCSNMNVCKGVCPVKNYM